MAEVHFRQATRVYPGNDEPAVDAFDLDIADGEFMVLVGPSGSGKTTALRMLAGLEEVDAGAIYIGERDVTDLPPKDRDVAMVFQNYALYPYLTVAANIGFPLKVARMKKAERERRVREVAELLELTRVPASASRGSCPAASVSGWRWAGRSSASRASFLMDEPLSNLDAKLRVQMRADIAALQSRLGVTTVYVTHDQAEAMTLGHRVAVLKDGRLQQCDVPRALYERPANTFVAGFIGSPSMNLLEVPLRRTRAARSAGSTCRSRPACQRRTASVVLGLRPEALELAPGGIDARVEVVEEIGADAYVFCVADYGGEPVKLVARTRVAARAGARGEGLALPARRRGARLRRRDGRPAGARVT